MYKHLLFLFIIYAIFLLSVKTDTKYWIINIPGPINKVRAGEVAVGFGLRHQAVKDKEEGLPIDYIDPIEGNFSLTEAIAVVDKGDKTNELAMEMAEVIVKNAREGIMNNYPVVLYEGEEVSSEYKPSNLKSFKESLTVDLLEDHQNLFKEAMSE